MNKDKTETTKSNLKSTLMFFNNKLAELNNRRQQINRSKGLAKYFAQSQKNTRNLAPLDTTLGIMSFSLYMVRFTTHLGLLVELILSRPQEKNNLKLRHDLYYSLFNDGLWTMVNLTQFFWLSYRNSSSAGLQGMQLETLAQLIDILLMIIRYQQDKKEYDLKYSQASPIERARLAIEWQSRELNMLRSLLISFCIALVFGLFSFSVAVPFSPLLSIIIISSSLLRVLIDNEKEKQLIHQLKLQQNNPQHIVNEERKMTAARLNDLNQILLHSVFLPLGLFLLLTTPLSLVIGASICMLLIHCCLAHLIDTYYLQHDILVPHVLSYSQ